jgi:hypothetical protein
MRTKLIVLLAGLVVVSALAFSGVAAAGGSRTRVTIQGPNGDFEGKLFNSDSSCLGGRTVRVFMQANPGDPFERIASDTSEQQGTRGVWSVGNTGFRDGMFYAKAARTTSCRGGRSPVIELQNGVPQ